MNRLPILCFALFLITAATSCENEERTPRGTISYFRQHLRPEMTYGNLIFLFGKPDGDMGSGIHIYFYNLQDGTRVYIGYTDRVLYANHRDQGDQLLEELL